MIVVMDAGNGGLKIGHLRAGRVERRSRLPARPLPDEAQVAACIPDDAADPVRLVSVVPALTDVAARAVARSGRRLLVADRATIPLPIAATIAHPERLGTDRLLAAWAARNRLGAPVIVADLGTATTVDGVDAAGAHAGGAIMAGLSLGLAALADGTAQLPEVSLDAPPARALGRDTAEAMRAGAVLGHLGAIRHLVERIERELAPAGPRPPVVVTGGLTALDWFAHTLLELGDGGRRTVAVDPDLLLHALATLPVPPNPAEETP